MKKIILLVFIVGLGLTAHYYGLTSYLTFSQLKARQGDLQAFYENKPFVMLGGYFLVYVLSTALSLPGAAILTLGAGAIFGFWKGVLLASFASTLGATLAFLVTRYLLRDSIEKRFKSQFKSINQGIEKDGAFYLFTLRLVPAFPFFLINMLMGLTLIPVLTFAIVSQVGMLLGTMVYVNAGTQLASLESASGILSARLIGSFVLLGLFPLVVKKIISSVKSRKIYKNFKKPKKFDYNIVAIGAGSAGLVTAYIAAAVKAKVALIEKNKMGGDCLNTGCVPSKALIKSSKIFHQVKNSQVHGIRLDGASIDFEKTMARLHGVIKAIEPHDSVERFSRLGVECISGEAEIVSPWEVKVNGRILTTKNIVLATGASPSLPPIPGLREINPLTSDNLWDIKKLPEKLLILGGGPIGSELTQAFCRLGSNVTQLEAGARLLSKEDEDVSEEVYKRFKHEGIIVMLGHKAVSFERRDGKKIVTAESENGKIEIAFDEVIVALGRKANTKIPGLDKLGLELTKQGTFSHDEALRTKYPNIYVCGDCAGPFQFTHTASHQAWYCAVNSLFSPFKTYKADYRVIPWTTFIDPEVAHVGLSEADAKEDDIEYEITKYELSDLDRAIAEGEAYGFVKVLTKKGKDQILGATIVGPRAAELLAEFVLAMKWNIGLNKILATIHTYPTFSEAAKYTAGNWKRAHQPEKLLKWIEKFHAWRRN